MKILIVNAGSSSLKYQLMDMTDESIICKGLCERIGGGGRIVHDPINGEKLKMEIELKDHTQAFHEVVRLLTSGDTKVIEDMQEIDAVGHRIVQGGAIFKKSELVTEQVMADIESLIPLAPLHNHAHMQGIRACREVLGTEIPEVVVFDTSFHSTMPPEAYLFGIPYKYYEKYAIRRYGFHGSSHRYISAKVAEEMGRPIEELKIVTCHIGNGSSLAAVKYGKVIDTTMGLTPLDGFIMGTRSGAVDPSAICYLGEKENMTWSQMAEMLNKESGMLGISELSSDSRDLNDAADAGNERAALTLKMQRYQILKFIGAFVAAMDGVDAIVFTGGIGENSDPLRTVVCGGLKYLGVSINEEVNKIYRKGKGGEISTPESKVKIYVLPTDEEVVIARDTKAIVEGLKK
ncbi:MAG: acetate kinase [Clostridia bacterium]|nr:acetate kinase [Clostridia bacterium]